MGSWGGPGSLAKKLPGTPSSFLIFWWAEFNALTSDWLQASRMSSSGFNSPRAIHSSRQTSLFSSLIAATVVASPSSATFSPQA